MFKELNNLCIFFEAPTQEFSVREVAKLLKIVPATASKQLKLFEKEGILKYRKERILDLYSANLESDVYRDLKMYYNLTQLRNSGLIESLNKRYLKPTLILLGSFSKGLDTEESDIDLVIISEVTKEFPERKHYENVLRRTIHLFLVKDIKELKNTHLINSILNGVVVQGELRWI